LSVDLALRDQAVIVTGGGSNIGRAIVLGFARERARIVIIDRDVAQSERTAGRARAIGAAFVEVVEADLASHDAADAACRRAMDLLGGVDVLVANVGGNRPNFFLETPPESWDDLLHLNLSATMSCARAVLPAMMAKRGGSIVATASTAAFGEPRQGVYAAAKAGVVAFVRTLALEYGRYGVRANLVAPGLVIPDDPDTIGEQSLWQDRQSIMNDAQVEYVLRNTPLRRLSEAADIANAVLFLASNATGRQLTGQMLTVSGGFAMR
jgi:NAD(P)-dependent dehydrogenase (short-subunit alcohol dehydrogenase family)